MGCRSSSETEGQVWLKIFKAAEISGSQVEHIQRHHKFYRRIKDMVCKTEENK
jgi:hypothetical protein